MHVAICVFFDQQFATTLMASEKLAIGALPDFEATELWLIAEDAGEVILTTSEGEVWMLQPELAHDTLWHVVFPQAAN